MNTDTKVNDSQRINTSDKIRKSQLVAIIRLANQDEVEAVVTCLIKGGVTALEITSNTPGFAQEIKHARAKHPEVLIGAGTIIDSKLAKEAIKAGAQFLVTPNTNKSVVKAAHKHGIPVLMGALTPTDIANCIKFKADFIKVFPAGSLGIKYFKDLQGPYSDIPLMPVGGVNIDNIEEWFEAGAIGVGVGNDLTQAANTVNEQEALINIVKSYVAKLPSKNNDT